jgi:hypothetical protein
VCERPSAQRTANGRCLSSAGPHPDIFRALRAPVRGKGTEVSASIPKRDSQPVATSHPPLAGTKLSANKSESIRPWKRPARTDQYQSNRLLRRGVQSIERLAKSASRKPCSQCRMASQCFWFLESLGKLGERGRGQVHLFIWTISPVRRHCPGRLRPRRSAHFAHGLICVCGGISSPLAPSARPPTC